MADLNKLIIGFTGSRQVKTVPEGLKKLLKSRASLIVHGGATGADSAIEKFAKENHIPTRVHKPNYSAYPGRERYAPLARNKTIVKDSDAMIGLWKPGSRGTTFTLNHSIKSGKPTFFADMSEESPKLLKLLKEL